jgi:predicted PurR-regulated permease PerM
MAMEQTDDPRARGTDTKAALRIMLCAVAVAAGCWLIYALSTVILLVVFSVLFAYLIAPLVKLTRRGLALGPHRQLPAAAGIAIVYLGIFAVLGAGLTWLVPRVTEQAAQFAKAAPAYVQSLNASGKAFSRIFRRLQAVELGTMILERATATANAAGEKAVTSFVRVAAFLPWLVLIPILAFFLLKDGDRLKQGAIDLLPDARRRADAARFVERVDRSLAAVIRAQLLACLIVGVLTGIGLALLGVPYAATLGVAAGVCEFIPLLGPLSVAGVAAVIGGVHRPILALSVLGFLGVLRVAQDYVIYPRLVGHTIHLHPLAVILAVLAGAELGGVVGVLLALPAFAVAAAAYDSLGELTERDGSG